MGIGFFCRVSFFFLSVIYGFEHEKFGEVLLSCNPFLLNVELLSGLTKSVVSVC